MTTKRQLIYNTVMILKLLGCVTCYPHNLVLHILMQNDVCACLGTGTPICVPTRQCPCHRAMAVLAWFENNARRKMLFPPQSSYVNYIKNICSCMKNDA